MEACKKPMQAVSRSASKNRNRCKSKENNKLSEMCQSTGGHLPTSDQIKTLPTGEDEYYLIQNANPTKAVNNNSNKWSHLRRGKIKQPCQLGSDSDSKSESSHTDNVALNCTSVTMTTAINSPLRSCRLHSFTSRCYCGGIISTAADNTMHDQSHHYRRELSCPDLPTTRISHGLLLPVLEEIPITSPDTYRPTCAATTIRDRDHKRVSRCHEPEPLLMSKLDYISNISLVKRTIHTLLIGILLALQHYGTRGYQHHTFAQQLPSDPRPTIYSGQVSFGLLLSAHSSLGSEMSTSASHQFNSLLAVNTSPNRRLISEASRDTLMKPRLANEMRTQSDNTSTTSSSQAMDLVADASGHNIANKRLRTSDDQAFRNRLGSPGDEEDDDDYENDNDEGHKSRKSEVPQAIPTRHRQHRQIFDRSHFRNLQQQKQQQQRQRQRTPANQPASSMSSSSGKSANSDASNGGMVLSNGCNQINPSALYAGMGAIWASHQANLVGDSPLTIGTYVYDSCNDLDVGQRQAVRIVSNLNAFQQTTCEAPRGSPISLTIAHGDQQLRAIQLLTSFKVPVITTKEHFALEDYNQLTRDQRRFLFSTAPSSRHLALGALRFAKRVVSRTIVSPKLPNQFHKMSSKNGLIVISRNLPARFISFLVEVIPNHVNYEILQSSQPIDQVRSVESVESIMGSRGGFASGSSLIPVGTGSSSVQSDNTMDSIAQNESRQNRTFLQSAIRSKRAYSHPSDDNTDSSSSSDNIGSSGSSGAGDSDGSSDGSPGSSSTRMLSPTILMFITPAEAIDLVTRLRNDLAEVSQYYSLIVSTREDISPALKTIFHRGGSRLCSGKSFYTISPKPDDIGEFSRYFRDTIQMEGESSDHPLITEFAKYQSTSKISADLDDISTEPVIKAVWAAAAAFKLVHRRECGATSSNESSNSDANVSQVSPKRQASGTSSGGQKSAQQECLIKMNKNMSTLVQRTLKRLDVYINSTGLQAFDGFRIKFDELNELMTNTFSIKYINKECELTEIGEYSGFKDSQLLIDEELLHKSLESALPDPWPMPATTKGSTSSTNNGSSESSTAASADSTGSASTESDGGSDNGLTGSGSPGDKNDASASEEATNSRHGDGTASDKYLDPNDADADISAALRRQAKRSKNLPHDLAALTLGPSGSQVRKKSNTKKAAPVTTVSGGRAMSPGVMDTTDAPYSTTTTRNLDGEAMIRALRASSSSTNRPTTTTQQKTMRRLKPFPSYNGTTLYDWIPKTDSPTTTAFNGLLYDNQPGDKEQLDGDLVDFMAKASTTRPPAHSTLPESGGNTDLDSTPAVKLTRNNVTNSHSLATTELSSKADSQTRSTLDTAASTTESSDYITIVPDLHHRTSTPHSYQYRSHPSSNYDLPDHTLAPMLATSTQSSYNNELPTIRINSHLRDLDTSPVPLPTMTPGYTSGSTNPTGINGPSVDQSSSERYAAASTSTGQNIDLKMVKSRLRWTYSSWFAMLILGANVCGALLTLYVLTFLLMKNCDGSLSRENQTIRSMYLLAIIVMLFGSTLFIAYPTPGLCLLRTSWHNFALVMIFGSLLLQTMQTRSLDSLGLGGRTNRLNQFLTLVFIVGVQVSFELQRWRYESTNYVNFINQYLGPSLTADYNIMAVSSFMNPLNTLNDQIRPVSIEISEKYQTLLHDCCTQHDLIQSQFYLWFILCLLSIFNITIRREGFVKNSSHHRIKSRADALSVFSVTLISVPIYCVSIILHVHGQNIINRDIVSSLTLISIAFITLIGIFIPIMRQMHRREGQALISKLSPTSSASSTSTNQNQVSATATASSTSSAGQKPVNSSNANLIISGGAPIDVTAAPVTTKASSSQAKAKHQRRHNNINGVFTMFPEFAHTGLRRPASLSGDSLLAGHSTRHRFKESKESRRQMGVALANLSPSADSLRGIGLMKTNVSNMHNRHSVITDKHLGHNKEHHIDHALLNLKLNLAPQHKDMQGVADDNNIDHEISLSPDIANVDLYNGSSTYRAATHENIANRHQRRQHDRISQHYDSKHHINHEPHRRSTNDNDVVDAGCGTERRLVMLDVDPHCPRHGAMKSNGNNKHSHRHEH